MTNEYYRAKSYKFQVETTEPWQRAMQIFRTQEDNISLLVLFKEPSKNPHMFSVFQIYDKEMQHICQAKAKRTIFCRTTSQ